MIKITIRKDDPNKNSVKWWVEGFEEKGITEKDIIEMENIIDNCKKNILDMMYNKKSLDSEEPKLELIQFKEFENENEKDC